MPTFKIEQLGKKFLDNLRDQSSDLRIARAIDSQLMQIAAYRDAYIKACGNAQVSRKIQECLVLQQGVDEAARRREATQCVARAYLNEGGIHEKFETVSAFAFEQMDEVDDPVFLYRFVYVTNLQLAVFQLNKAVAKRDELRAPLTALLDQDTFLRQIGWIFPQPRFDRLEQELLQMKAAPEPVDGTACERRLASIQTELDELNNTFRFNSDKIERIRQSLSRQTPEVPDSYEGLDEALEQALSAEALRGLDSPDGEASDYKRTLTDYLQNRLEPILEQWPKPAP